MTLPIEFHRSAPSTRPPAVVVRPVVEDWVCQRSGDCCRAVDLVVMTFEEQQVVMRYAEQHLTIGQLNRVTFSHHRDPRFVELNAGPCPFLEGRNQCLVHPVRPYNCRRFGCLRPDVEAEPLVMAPLSRFLKFGSIGCSNLRERLVQSRIARRAYALLQRKGQRWALAHGWRSTDVEA
jgi:Fe-S-cluster containining protein